MDFHDKIRKAVEGEPGWFAIGVGGTEEKDDELARPHWTYTIGLWRNYGHPEVMVYGLQFEIAHAVFYTLVERLQEGQKYEVGPLYYDLFSDDFPTAFRYMPEDEKSDTFGQAYVYYDGEEFEILQMVFTDAEGRWPWDEGSQVSGMPVFIPNVEIVPSDRENSA